MYPEYCVVAKARIQRFKVSNQSQRQNVIYNIWWGDISLCRILYYMWVRPPTRDSSYPMSLDHSPHHPAHPK